MISASASSTKSILKDFYIFVMLAQGLAEHAIQISFPRSLSSLTISLGVCDILNYG
ncbi:MAG: hypothetical protein HY006_02495 [Candidatus Sungbacteria bacterium]|nr:hypothetical protein [Candidatus Sungbacteria bacterium]